MLKTAFPLLTDATKSFICAQKNSSFSILNLNIKFIILSKNTFVSDCCHKSRKSWFLIINAESDVLVKNDKFIRYANNDVVFIDEATSSDKLFA